MTDINNKISTNTGEKIYTSLEPGEMVNLQDSFKPIFEKLDTDHNSKISSAEVSVFNKKVQEFAGADGILDDTEANKLAQYYNINFSALAPLGIKPGDIVKFVMNYTSSDALAENMGTALHGEWYHFGMAEPDKENFKKMYNEIDKTNIAYVYHNYNYKSLASDIQQHFDYSESKEMLVNLFNLMQEKAIEKNVPIKNLCSQFEEALKFGKDNSIVKIIDEMAERIYNAENAPIYAATKGRESWKISDKNLISLINLAKNSGVREINAKDLAGDGILGNNPSEPTAKTHKKESATILRVVNNMMQDPAIKEKLQACVRKEDTYMLVSFSGIHTTFITREGIIVNNENNNLVEEAVVGDGDMSFFVYSIRKQAEKDNRTDVFNDDNKLEEYILSLVNINKS